MHGQWDSDAFCPRLLLMPRGEKQETLGEEQRSFGVTPGFSSTESQNSNMDYITHQPFTNTSCFFPALDTALNFTTAVTQNKTICE